MELKSLYLCSAAGDTGMSSCYFVEPCTLLVLQLPGLDFSRRRLIHLGVSDQERMGGEMAFFFYFCLVFPPPLPQYLLLAEWKTGESGKNNLQAFLSLLLGEMLMKSPTMKVDLLIFLCF